MLSKIFMLPATKTQVRLSLSAFECHVQEEMSVYLYKSGIIANRHTRAQHF